MSAENVDALRRNAEVDSQIRKAKRQQRKEAKILLLGSGDSGKTTIMKQMRLLTDGSFSKGELESYRQLVFANLITGMKALVDCLAEVDLTIEDDTTALDAYRTILAAPDVRDGQAFPDGYLPLFKLLWEHPVIREGINHCRRFAIPDNVPYFYSHLDRLWAPEYSPTNLDIVQTRARTAGIVETTFQISDSFAHTAIPDPSARAVTLTEKYGRRKNKGAETIPGISSIVSEDSNITELDSDEEKPRAKFQLKFSTTKTLRFVDVGGQKSERRKWIHCFEDVTAILFLVSLSGYDQCLVEERSTNQMSDAMTLWEGICKMEWFRETSLILFLNKEDLFRAKVAESPIRRFFPDYNGPLGDAEAGKEYFQKRFIRIEHKGTLQLQQLEKSGDRKTPSNKPYTSARRRQVYPHFTTAVNTSLVLNVMIDIADTVLRDQLKDADIL